MDKSLRNIIISFAIAGLIFILFIVMIKINIIPIGINIITKTQKDVVQKELNLLEKSFEAIIFTERNRIQDMTATEDVIASFTSKEVSGRAVRYLFEYMSRNKYCLGVSFMGNDRKIFFTIPEYSPIKNSKLDMETYNIIQQDKLLVGRPIPKQIIIAYPIQSNSNLLGYSLFHYSGAYILKEIAKKTYDAIQTFSIESMTLIPELNMIVYNIPNNIGSEKSTDGKTFHNIFEELYQAKTDTFLGPVKFGKNEYYFFNSFDTERMTRHILVQDKRTVSVSPWQFGIIAFCALSMIALLIYIMLTFFMGGDKFVSHDEASYSSGVSAFKPALATKIQEEVEEEEFLTAVSDEEKKKDFFFEQVKNEAHFDHELKTLVEDINEPKSDIPLEVSMDDNLDIEIPLEDTKSVQTSDEKESKMSVDGFEDIKDISLDDSFNQMEEPLLEEKDELQKDKELFGSESIDDLEKELKTSYPDIDTIAEQATQDMDFNLDDTKKSDQALPDFEFNEEEKKEEKDFFDPNKLDSEDSFLDNSEIEIPSLEELNEEEIELPGMSELVEEKPMEKGVDENLEDVMSTLPDEKDDFFSKMESETSSLPEDLDIPSIDELTIEEQQDGSIENDKIEDIELPSLDSIKEEDGSKLDLDDLKSDEGDLENFTLPEMDDIEAESSGDVLSEIMKDNKTEFDESSELLNEDVLNTEDLKEFSDENKLDKSNEIISDDFFSDIESNEVSLSESELENVAMDVENLNNTLIDTDTNSNDIDVEYGEKTYDSLVTKEAVKNSIDYIAVYKLNENKFINDGSNKKEFNAIQFVMDDPIVSKLEELKKDIFIPVDIYKFKPLIEKNSELFEKINALYIKGIYDEGQLVGMIQLYSGIGKEKSKEEYFQIASKIQEML